MTDLQEVLRQRFGYESFRTGQREVMEHLLAGRSATAVFPTGSGKSLCYQLPALLLPGLTLVVSPLIALMKDQIDGLAAQQIAARRLDSTLSADEYRDVMREVRQGSLRLLYVAPERFQNERFRESMVATRISLFAVDEAHCVSEWGHNFRPDYLKLAEFAKTVGAERMLALTATATPQVLQDICTAFGVSAECAVRTGFYRPNLSLFLSPLAANERDGFLLQQLKQRKPGPAIVYTTLQRTAEEVARLLSAAGYEAQPYHAGLDDARRAAVQDWFLTTKSGIVVATIAFGMGINKPDIRYIYHYNLPKSLENYSQEIGRSGRDGLPAVCEMLVCLGDLNTLENFALGDTPSLAQTQALVDEIFGQGQELEVSYYDLAARHDIRQLVVRTLFTYLELDGYLVGGTPYYTEYKFKPLKSSQEILQQFAGERREFLHGIFGQVSKAKVWCHLDLDRAVQATRSARERVVRALEYLAEQGWLELQTAGMKHRYRRLKVPGDVTEVGGRLHARAVERERQELQRLDQVVDLVQCAGCQFTALCRHFGELREEPCGHCAACRRAGEPLTLAARPTFALDHQLLQEATDLLASQVKAPLEPRLVARFLCGVSSPRLTRAKLSSHPRFGALAHVPFRDVLARLANGPHAAC